MENYETPTLEIIYLDSMDIITGSEENDDGW